MPHNRKTSTASRRTSAAICSGHGRRDEKPRLVLAVLVVVVVELAARDDLARDRGPRTVVAQDGALELARVDPLLDEHALVVAEGHFDRGGRRGPVLDLRDSHRRASVGGLDEEREIQAAAPDPIFHVRVAPVAAVDRREEHHRARGRDARRRAAAP